MASLADLFVGVHPDTSKFEPELKKKLRGASRASAAAGRDSGKRFSGGMLSGVKGLATGLAGAFLVTKGIDVFGGFIADARESQKVGKLTANVIKSTGGAANVTAGQVGKLATAISNKTGIDDEAIQANENLLLTFTNVRNEVGKGNDIFNQATATVTDMSAALGQSGKSSAIQLGKALNDPIKGITALSRVGVSFTAKQKEQIKTLVKSGDTLGAQKVILKELGKEFGGAAAAATNPMDKLKVSLGNVGEQIGGFLLPWIDKAATWLAKNLPGAIDTATTWFRDNLLPILKNVGTWIRDTLIPAISNMAGWIKKNSDWLIPLVAAIGTFVAIIKVVTTVIRIWTAVQTALNIVMSLNPIGIVIAIIAALVVGLIVAYKKSETFRNIVNGVWTKIKAVVGAVVKWFTDTVWPKLQAVWDGIVDGIKTVARWFKDRWGNIKTIVTGAFDVIKGAARTLWLKLQTAFWNILGAFATFAEKIVSGAATAFGWVPGIGPKLKDAAKKVRDFKDDVNRHLHAINDENVNVSASAHIDLSKIPPRSRGAVMKMINTRYAKGGAIRGPGSGTSDSVPAWLSHGEHVWTAREVRNAGGHDAIEAMRKQFRYAGGGSVDVNLPRPGIYHRAQRGLADAVGEGVGKALKPALQRVVDQRIERGVAALAAQAATAGTAAGTTGASVGGGRFRPVRRGRPGGIHDQWTGFPAVNVGVPIGTPVYAGASGRVVVSRDMATSYGHWIKLANHGFGTLYAHLSRRVAQLGASVVGGQLIGYSGSTGNSTGPHLHFGARGLSPNAFFARGGPVGFDRGGVLPPGLTMAYNGTGRDEAVIPGGDGRITLVVGGEAFPAYVRREAESVAHARERATARKVRAG